MGNTVAREDLRFNRFQGIQGYILSEIFQESHEIDLEQNKQRQFLTLSEKSAGKHMSRSPDNVKKPQTKKQEIVKNKDPEQYPCDFFTQRNSFKQPENQLSKQSNSEALPCQGAAAIPTILESPKPAPQEHVGSESLLKKTQDNKSVNSSSKSKKEKGNSSIFGKKCCIFEQENQDGRQIIGEKDVCQRYLAEIERKLLGTWHNRCAKEDWKEFEPLLKFVYDLLNINGLNYWNEVKDLMACFSQEIKGFESKKRKNVNLFDSNFDQTISSGEEDEEQKVSEVKQRFSRSWRYSNNFNPSFNQNYFMDDDDFGIVRRNGYYWNKKPKDERIGLKNYGKTCYMNALFQCLYRVEPFSEKICEIEEIPNHSFGEKLVKLFQSMKIRNARQIDEKHKDLLEYIYETRSEFQRNQVGDACILFRAILDELSYNRDLKESPYSKMFAGGPLMKILQCQTCRNKKEIHDSIEVLQVQDINFLRDNQKIFFKSDNETRFCSNHNGKSRFNCSYKAASLPKVLVVKIYDTKESRTHVKILPKIVLEQSKGNDPKQAIEYEFIASVLNSSKGENGCHSVALVREQEDLMIYDDSFVTEGSLKTRYHPQLLFYVQKNYTLSNKFLD